MERGKNQVEYSWRMSSAAFSAACLAFAFAAAPPGIFEKSSGYC